MMDMCNNENEVILEILQKIGENRGCYVSRTEKSTVRRHQILY